jgi:hypothetical protein
MIAAEDEASWEGDPSRCEQAFKTAREKAEANGYAVREVTLHVPWKALDEAFLPVTVTVTTDPT